MEKDAFGEVISVPDSSYQEPARTFTPKPTNPTPPFTKINALGQGGQAVTTLVHDANGNEFVDKRYNNYFEIKAGAIVLPEEFERDVALLQTLSHPHLLPVLGSYVETEVLKRGNRQYPHILTPYMSGGSLEERFDRGPIPVADALRFTREMAEVIAYLQERSIIHTDVKPANIFVDATGNSVLGDLQTFVHYHNKTRTIIAGLTGHGEGELYRDPHGGNGKENLTTDLYSLSLSMLNLMLGERLSAQDHNHKPHGLNDQVYALLKRSITLRDRVEDAATFLRMLNDPSSGGRAVAARPSDAAPLPQKTTSTFDAAVANDPLLRKALAGDKPLDEVLRILDDGIREEVELLAADGTAPSGPEATRLGILYAGRYSILEHEVFKQRGLLHAQAKSIKAQAEELVNKGSRELRFAGNALEYYRPKLSKFQRTYIGSADEAFRAGNNYGKAVLAGTIAAVAAASLSEPFVGYLLAAVPGVVAWIGVGLGVEKLLVKSDYKALVTKAAELDERIAKSKQALPDSPEVLEAMLNPLLTISKRDRYAIEQKRTKANELGLSQKPEALRLDLRFSDLCAQSLNSDRPLEQIVNGVELFERDVWRAQRRDNITLDDAKELLSSANSLTHEVKRRARDTRGPYVAAILDEGVTKAAARLYDGRGNWPLRFKAPWQNYDKEVKALDEILTDTRELEPVYLLAFPAIGSFTTLASLSAYAVSHNPGYIAGALGGAAILFGANRLFRSAAKKEFVNRASTLDAKLRRAQDNTLETSAELEARHSWKRFFTRRTVSRGPR